MVYWRGWFGVPWQNGHLHDPVEIVNHVFTTSKKSSEKKIQHHYWLLKSCITVWVCHSGLFPSKSSRFVSLKRSISKDFTGLNSPKEARPKAGSVVIFLLVFQVMVDCFWVVGFGFELIVFLLMLQGDHVARESKPPYHRHHQGDEGVAR